MDAKFLLTIAILFVAPRTSHGDFFEDLRAANRQKPAYHASMREWDSFELRRWGAIQDLARSLVYDVKPGSKEMDNLVRDYQKYLAEIKHDEAFFQSYDGLRLQWATTTFYFRRLLDRLHAGRLPSIEKLLALTTPKNSPSGIVFWQRNLKMATHRRTRHIGINLSKLDEADSPLLFVHELAHRAQRSLNQVESEYNVRRISLAHFKESREDRGQRASNRLFVNLDKWAESGLELQLLNEWRAWVVTFDIYEKILALKLPPEVAPWQRIEWVEKILSERMPGENLKKFVFRYLDREFTDPVDPEFVLKEITLKRHRAQLRERNARNELSLRELEEVFEAK